jgi:hypothetical protein
MCSERQGQPVGGPFSGVNEICARAEQTLDRVDSSLEEVRAEVKATAASLRSILDEAKAVIAQLHIGK